MKPAACIEGKMLYYQHEGMLIYGTVEKKLVNSALIQLEYRPSYKEYYHEHIGRVVVSYKNLNYLEYVPT